jgi:flagellar L-ring protein precursor FlgH
MGFGVKKIIIAMLIIGSISSNAYAESLFRAGVSQNIYPITPRPLYSSVKARAIGDLVTITISEQSTTSDDITLNVTKTSSITDNFRSLINNILPGKIIPDGLNNFGGNQSVANKANSARTTKLADTITAQVVQVLPNGNLVVQGKKTAINAGEQMNIILSGIIDPRFIDGVGNIPSSQVANLQVAVVGKGTISRSNNEGVVNKFVRYMF